ncbi:YqgE/AlgH family protein [Shimia thalassica]|uniref:YqgE/AlgH family protein n=1 Tax=Shimia thalassica TaxID=1715693 RepID=UPI0026E2AE97|nr:YqgE/AlgH family protein [Shimia thalassica]MDO6521667.1 YqgE/AlgH family protein [Shimia thalassica]
MNLTGKILIAMPGMGDTRFANSVVLLCDHSAKGAMGLIVNKPIDGMSLSDLMKQVSMDGTDETDAAGLYFGGPVEPGRGFMLHTPDYHSELSTLRVDGRFSMTATLDILEEIAAGEGPSSALMALGYSGWGPGQLENEIGQNGWLTAEPSQALVFGVGDGDVWPEAIRSLGIDPLSLSATAGHA